MSNQGHIEAPGRSALWTEAALRALTGAAFITTQNTGIHEDDPPYTPEQAKAIALDAMAIATAFEAACVAAHEAEQREKREAAIAILASQTAEVLRVGRYRFRMGLGVHERTITARVAKVEGEMVFFAGSIETGLESVRAPLSDVATGEGFEPASLDAPAPTTAGGEERS